jgi:DNA-binding LacI/PurR family transcriptional regulator
MSVTIEDVARQASVSTATVSRVFNNSARVSAETRNRVLETASRMNYKPRSYRRQQGTGKAVGIVFSNRFFESLTSTPFYAEVMAGVEQSLRERNHDVLIRALTDQAEQDLKSILSLCEKQRLGGLLVIGYEISRDFILKLRNLGIPLVLLDNDLWADKFDCIVNEDYLGAVEMTDYLIGLGHRRIAFICGPLRHKSLADRYAGYKDSLAKAGIPFDESLVRIAESYHGMPEGEQMTVDILSNCSPHPTAIFAGIDLLAIGALRAAQQMGRTVPGDLSIAGYDDIEMVQHMAPPLTTVRNFKFEMGYLAGKRLDELMSGSVKRPVKHTLAVELVIRGSVSQP